MVCRGEEIVLQVGCSGFAFGFPAGFRGGQDAMRFGESRNRVIGTLNRAQAIQDIGDVLRGIADALTFLVVGVSVMVHVHFHGMQEVTPWGTNLGEVAVFVHRPNDMAQDFLVTFRTEPDPAQIQPERRKCDGLHE